MGSLNEKEKDERVAPRGKLVSSYGLSALFP